MKNDNGHGYILVPFFTAWNYSRCYLSGFKKEKRRGKSLKNFILKYSYEQTN